jgi:predicted anti-sigma-YlaC factor YlaD
MTCEACELALAKGERSTLVEAHLEACAVCRKLAPELALNAEALAAMRGEIIPTAPPRARPRWVWAAAAAAAFVVALGWIATKPEKSQRPSPRPGRRRQ